MSEVVGEAASRAPARPGCYFLLGADGELLYIGKAGDLRRRLRDHGRASMAEGYVRLRPFYEDVREVRWVEVATEDEAVALEADLIVCLQPPANAAIIADGKWTYIVASQGDGDAMTFELAHHHTPRRGQRVYGCFPHLGTGVSSRPGIACSDGLGAVYRLVWSATPLVGSARVPAAIARIGAPRRVELAVSRELREALHALFSGRSDRLLRSLSIDIHRADVPPVLRPALARDLRLARDFYQFGPRALQLLRRRHALPAGPVTPETIIDARTRELRDAIGTFTVAPADPAPHPGLRRTRSGWIP